MSEARPGKIRPDGLPFANPFRACKLSLARPPIVTNGTVVIVIRNSKAEPGIAGVLFVDRAGLPCFKYLTAREDVTHS
jgi:hypothetical protein